MSSKKTEYDRCVHWNSEGDFAQALLKNKEKAWICMKEQGYPVLKTQIINLTKRDSEDKREELLARFLLHLQEKKGQLFQPVIEGKRNLRAILLHSLRNYVVDDFRMTMRKNHLFVDDSFDELEEKGRFGGQKGGSPEEVYLEREAEQEIAEGNYWVIRHYQEITRSFREVSWSKRVNAAPLFWVLLLSERVELYQKLRRNLNGSDLPANVKPQKFIEDCIYWTKEEENLVFSSELSITLQDIWNSIVPSINAWKEQSWDDLMLSIQKLTSSKTVILLSKWSKWKERAREHVINTRKNKGYSSDSIRAFYLHWFPTQNHNLESYIN